VILGYNEARKKVMDFCIALKHFFDNNFHILRAVLCNFWLYKCCATWKYVLGVLSYILALLAYLSTLGNNVLTSMFCIISGIKSVRWAGNVAHLVEKRIVYRASWGNWKDEDNGKN
jgi:hypothetical protein